MARISKVSSISLPPEMLKEAEEVAREENRTKSELVREALRRYLSEKRWQKIRQWGNATVKKYGLEGMDETDIAEMITEMRRSGKLKK